MNQRMPGRGRQHLVPLIATLTLLLCCGANTRLRAQSTTNGNSELPQAQIFFIEEIIIKGNKKTKKQVILREMETEAGEEVTVEQLELDRLRIESLGLFSRVQMEAELRQKGIAVIITVSEQWYLFPLPIIYFNDKEYKLNKLSYGASLIHYNFRGRAELLQVTGVLGFNPSLYFTYSNPWLFGDSRIFLSTQLYVSKVQNKSASLLQDGDVYERQFGGGIRVGKRLTLKTSLSLLLNYRQLEIPELVTVSPADSTSRLYRLTLHPSNIDRLPQIGLSLSRDYRDFVFFPTRGSFARINLTHTGLPGSDHIDYSRLSIDLRKYLPLGRESTFAFRYAVDLSRGRVPSYDRLFFGFDRRIRGEFFDRYEGDHRMLANAELRFPLLPVRYYSLGDDKLGGYMRNLKFGISGSFFFDMGTLWQQDRDRSIEELPLLTGPFGNQKRPNKWIYGVGAGLNFHLPYIQVARLEYAWNQDRQSQIIFDTQVAF